MKEVAFITLMLLAVVSQVSCQENDSQYDLLMNEMFDSDGPGGVALIARDGQVLYRKAFGMANLELGVKMTPGHVFRIGSITKQFTACAILKLAEEGKLFTQATGQDNVELIPVGKDEFKVSGVDASVKFNRNADDVIEGLTLYQNGEHRAKKILEQGEPPID